MGREHVSNELPSESHVNWARLEENTSPLWCVSQQRRNTCVAWVLVTGINQGPLPGLRDLYPQGCGGGWQQEWGERGDTGDPLTHTCTRPLNGKCSPPTTYGVPSP